MQLDPALNNSQPIVTGEFPIHRAHGLLARGLDFCAKLLVASEVRPAEKQTDVVPFRSVGPHLMDDTGVKFARIRP